MAEPNITRIGKYEVTGVLGRGGMGLVYRAFDRNLGREVAIKTVTEGLSGDKETLQRFYREAAKTGMLKHQNIVTIYDLGEQDGFPYIVMEYVAGEGLDRIIQSGKPISLPAKLKIIEQVCHALGYAHRNEVIHRDVKPANVIVQPDGVAKLLDFGIARREREDQTLTRTGNVIGTLHYMAPERFRGYAFDGRSDIFSTGVMLFQLLTGVLPFSGEDASVVQRVLNEKQPSLDKYLHTYPKPLDAILDRAMAKRPDERYGTADEMAAELYGVGEALKREQVAQLFQQAEILVAEQEHIKAREILLQLAKIDSQHAGARQLMNAVQQQLSQRMRAEQIGQLRSEAEAALQDKEYDQAVEHLQEALKLDPESSELQEELGRIREKKALRARIDGYLRQADDACQQGDLHFAQSILEQAMQLDREDSRVLAAYSSLVSKAEEAAREEKAAKLLDSARNEMIARRFTAALELLHQVEQVDPANPQIIPLLEAARSGQEQERRRRVVEQLQREAAAAIRPEERERALSRVNEALQVLVNEPGLLKLRSQLERQIRDFETRRVVDETVQRCRSLLETAPEEALQLVRRKLAELPGQERLLALQSSLEEHLARIRTERSRVLYLAQAREALDQKRYRDAARILEKCQAEGASSEEISDLLEFARTEANQQERQSLIEQHLVRAQALMAAEDYDEVIRLLQPAVAQTGDASLRELLENARSRHQTLQRKTEIVLTKGRAFAQYGQFEEGLRFLEAQTQAVLQASAVQELLQGMREAREREGISLRAIGRAYAALDSQDVASGESALLEPQRTNMESPLLQHIMQAFEARRKYVGQRAFASAVENAKAKLRACDPRAAADTLAAVSSLTQFVPREAQEEWRRLAREARKARLLARLGIRVKSKV